MKPKLFLRADGNAQTGLGHLYRVLALAEACNIFFDCLFLVKDSAELASEIVGNSGKVIELYNDLDSGTDPFLQIGVHDIIVLDGYHFTTDFQQAVQSNYHCKLVCIDDIHSFSFVSDVVINPAGGISDKQYSAPSTTSFLLGPRYAMLRHYFYTVDKSQRNFNSIENVLICFGGADPGNETLNILKYVQNIHPGIKISVVVGSAYQHINSLKNYCADQKSVCIHYALDGEAMVKLMQECDTAVCSASTICYEFSSVTGLLFLKQTATNQAGIYQFMINESLALPFDKFEDIYRSNEIRQIQTEQKKQQEIYFDGNAGKRLLKALKKLYLRDNIVFRSAEPADVDLYYRWANDMTVRNSSFNTELIGYDEHCGWFSTNLSSTNAVLYVATTTTQIPAGSIRFKIKDDIAELSYLVDPLFRGAGLGEIILREGVAKLMNERKEVKVVEGLVKYTNIASLKAFEAAGYRMLPDKDPKIFRFQLKR